MSKARKHDLLAPATPDEPEELRDLRRFLDGEGPLPSLLDDEGAEALVDALVRKGDAERIGQLSAHKNKALAKQARRGVHLLRTRGVKAEVAPPVAAAAPARAAEPEEEVASLMTAPLRDGEYGIWYTWTTPSGWVQICQVTATEKNGIERFQRFRASRKQWRASEKSIQTESKLPVVRIPTAYARWLVEEAYQRSLAVGRSAREYAEARPMLAPPVPVERHPGFDVSSEEAVRAVQDPERVLDLPEAESWIPDEDSLREAMRELREAEASPLVLDERQQLERQHDVIRKVASAALEAGLRKRLSRRLLDLAYFLTRAALEGQKGARDYGADATLAVAGALHMEDPSIAAADNRIARRLYARVLDRLPRPAPKPPGDEPGGGLLVTP
jgi:hypothetical protein